MFTEAFITTQKNKLHFFCLVYQQQEHFLQGTSLVFPVVKNLPDNAGSAAKSLQWCLTLCDPMDCSPPGSSIHEILQARILEWVAMPLSRGSFQPRDRTDVSLCLLHQQPGSLPLAPPGKPANEGGHGFNPWSRKIPHSVEQLSLGVTTSEPMCCKYWSPQALEPALCNKRSHTMRSPHTTTESSPHLLQLEKAHAAVKTQHRKKQKLCSHLKNWGKKWAKSCMYWHIKTTKIHCQVKKWQITTAEYNMPYL